MSFSGRPYRPQLSSGPRYQGDNFDPPGWTPINEQTAIWCGQVGITTMKSGGKYWVRPDWAQFMPEFETICRLAGPEAAREALLDFAAKSAKP